MKSCISFGVQLFCFTALFTSSPKEFIWNSKALRSKFSLLLRHPEKRPAEVYSGSPQPIDKRPTRLILREDPKLKRNQIWEDEKSVVIP